MYNTVVGPYVNGFSEASLQWVYNILEGKKEQQHVLVNTNDYLIVKDYKWSDEENKEGMHMLAMPKVQGELKSIRDLRGQHVSMLEDMLTQGLEVRT